jgi:hypothetical protein
MTVDRDKKAKRQGQIGMNTRYKNERESGKTRQDRWVMRTGDMDKKGRRIRQEGWETG